MGQSGLESFILGKLGVHHFVIKGFNSMLTQGVPIFDIHVYKMLTFLTRNNR